MMLRSVDMKFPLFLMAVILCEASKVYGGLAYPGFPNLRTVYHGHGATSYQNVQIQSHGHTRIPLAEKTYEGHDYNYVHDDQPVYADYHHYYDVAPVTPDSFTDPRNTIDDHFVVGSIGSYGGNDIGHVESDGDISPVYYITSNENDYEYH